MKRLALILAVGLAAISCGDDADGNGGGGGTGGSGGGGDLCAAPAASTQVVPETQQTAAAPDPAGGTITPGTYHLVAFDIHPPATADENTRARVLVIRGDGTITSYNTDPGGSAEIAGGTYMSSGNQVTFEVTCPFMTSLTFGYTATASEFWIHDDEPNVQKYALQ